MVPKRALSLLFVIAVAALLASPPLRAHDLWIAPSSFEPALGEPIRLQLVLADGERIETVPRDDAGIVRFVAVGPDGDQPVAGLDGVAPAGFLRPTAPGWYTILYESSPSFTALAPETFRAYLQEKGLEATAQMVRARADGVGSEAGHGPGPAQPTSELFRRSIKARVLVTGPGDPTPSDPGEEKPAGLPFELVLERATVVSDPAEHQVVMRLLLDGSPLGGTQVDVRRLDDRKVAATSTTDREGRVHFRLEAGSWVATSVHLDRSRPAATADWESVWSSLTFNLN